ncbi:DALR anticodon-binding domain-containing protein [Streptomyces diacarni]|uniref:DALR anticodon-binding domain-containing protein n=1 Tax=Streptomyces diacarni TaxID=2800381 RepID=UPI0033F747CA
MTPAQLSRIIRHVLCRALCDDLGSVRDVPVVVESPPRRGGGDYATGVAFRAAALTGRSPREIAELVCARLIEPATNRHDVASRCEVTNRHDATSRVGAFEEVSSEVAAPEHLVADARVVGGGFVNVTLTPQARAALVRGLAAGRPAGAPDPVAEPGVVPSDAPARDISRWAECTGESPAALAVRTERASSLFRVQYAHARSCSLLRNGRRLGVEPVAEDAEPLVPAGTRLLALLADRARVTAPARLARHLDAVAGAFAVFRETAEPLPRGEEKPAAAHRGRLALAEATGAVLAGGLSQLGVTAPAHI